MANFVKVMFDTKSGADFKYKYKVLEDGQEKPAC